jgi:hypothetical protein
MTDKLIEAVARAICKDVPDGDEFGCDCPNGCLCPDMRQLAVNALAAIEASGTHVVVPVRPTELMLAVFRMPVGHLDYAAMLAARPKVQL